MGSKKVLENSHEGPGKSLKSPGFFVSKRVGTLNLAMQVTGTARNAKVRLRKTSKITWTMRSGKTETGQLQRKPLSE